MLVALPLLALFSALIAACGGSPSASNTTSTTVAAAAGTTAPAGTTASSTTTTAAASTTTLAKGSASGSQFCQFASNVSKQSAVSAAAAASAPTSLKTDYQRLMAEEPTILAQAPAAIKGDFQTVFTYLNKFYSDLASINFDFTKLTPAMEKDFTSDSAGLSSASKAIENYVTQACGLSTSTS